MRSSLTIGRAGAGIYVLIVGLSTLLCGGSALAEKVFVPSAVQRGVLLVSNPSLDDPNFHHTVLLIVDHGPGGTLGLVLNRSTDVPLSQALPDLAFLKGTGHRLFSGGPVEPTRPLVLYRLKEPTEGARWIYGEIYIGRNKGLLERLVTSPQPTETFRVFAGHAGWAPGQLEYEMLQGAWGVLPVESFDVFDKDPATIWQDSLSLLQAPKVIANQ